MSGWWRVKVRGEVEIIKKTEQKEEKCEKKIEKEKVKMGVLHGCSKHKSARFDNFICLENKKTKKKTKN